MSSRQVVRKNVRCSRHPHRVRSRRAVRKNVRCSRHPHRVSSHQVVPKNVRCSRHPNRVSSRQVVPKNVRCSRHPNRVPNLRDLRRNVRSNRHRHRVRSRRAVRKNVRYSRHRHPVRSRRDLRQVRSSRVSAAPAVPPGSHRVPSRHNSRSGRLRSLPRRYSHRPRQLDPGASQRAFVPPPAQDSARRLDDVRGARREVREGDRVMIQEPGRVIIREDGRTIIRHSEVDRFRWQARDVRVERRGADTVTVFERQDGSRIYTVTDESGRLLRRYRRAPDGREIIIIDNRYSGPPRVGGYFIDLPPPVIRIPRERYIVDAQYARPDDIYGALWAAPVEHIERPYTLDEIRYSPRLLERMPRVDLDTVTFDTGSWEVTPDQVERLAVIADGINRAIAANPSEVFLVEGHTDAVGSDVDNLSLSDRRAESVALVLSQQFGVPAENLTTQGYGEQYLKVPTQGPERANRRVTVRRITPLLTGQNEAVPVTPR